MKKILFVLVSVILLAFTACDRFEKDYLVKITPEDFLASFETNTESSLRNHEIAQIMTYYDAQYLNNGIDKTEMQTFYTKDWSQSATMSIVALNADSLKYQITISDDSLRYQTSWIDYGKKVGDSYKWYGDQVNVTENPKQIVLGELITGTTCQNCPQAEHKLHEIITVNPERFVYIEYHFQDSLALGSVMNEWNGYYNVNSSPTVVFQGKVKLTGSEETTLNQYQGAIDNFLTQDAQLTLTDVTTSVTGKIVTGQVKINLLDELDMTNCYLQLAVYEEETNALNYIGEKCLKVVRAKTKQSLNGVDLNSPVSFTITSSKYLDSDVKLVIWVQKMTNISDYDPQIDGIYNCVEVDLR